MCYGKYVFCKTFKSSVKPLPSPFLVVSQTFFTWRALGRYSKVTQRHSKHLDTQSYQVFPLRFADDLLPIKRKVGRRKF